MNRPSASVARAAVPQADPAHAGRHSGLDNAQGMLFGIVMTAFGLSMLKAAGLITGQFAGLALLLSQVNGWPVGTLFLVLNLPSYLFALRYRGWRFTLKTLVAVAGVSALAQWAPHWIAYDHLDPRVAAIVGGFAQGVGLIALFRHGASCGGIGIIALQVQERTGFRAGWVQLAFDLGLFAVAACLLDPRTVMLSLLGAAVLNLAIALNHRRDWYVAQ
ncbi:YitT family protein [Xanthomonas massiliensis]|uniref:YitT family protein n=1 Tax=Xanthomonas massiliensis TaxID=1720302 RepID=UPI000B1EC93E|nr:YitT family protein [Xanthomonas massiliensis]